jgi:hypothetical protein
MATTDTIVRRVLADRIAGLDAELFAHITNTTTDEDRKALLAIHHALASRDQSFSYLEIGSERGGSLQALIADPRCTSIVSIDPRTHWTPDDRPGQPQVEYADNTTERMLSLLAGVPDADLSKLKTIEASTEDLDPRDMQRPDLCFIDGEHTQAAAVFHDFHIVEGAILEFLRETPRPRRAYLMLHAIFVVELGGTPALLEDPAVRGQLTPRSRLMTKLAAFDTLLLAADIRRRKTPAQ